MNRIFTILTLITMVLFSVSAIAADSVVVIPLSGKKSVGDAVAADVIEGKTFSNKDAVNIPGTMVNNGAVSFTPDTTDQTVPEGYHDGTGTVTGDANLVSANIKKGISLFGVSGNDNVVDTSDATAVAASLLKDERAYVKGQPVVGTTGLFWGCSPGSSEWSIQVCLQRCVELYTDISDKDKCDNLCYHIAAYIISASTPLAPVPICGGPID